MFLMIFLKFYAISEQFMYIFRETSSYVSHCARFSRNLTKSSPYQHNLRDFRETSPNPRQILTKSAQFARFSRNLAISAQFARFTRNLVSLP